MTRGGLGAASVVLVFVVLCLAIFALISITPALMERRLADDEVRLVQEFFAADALAEQIVATVVDDPSITSIGGSMVMGIEVRNAFAITAFEVPINEDMVLSVQFVRHTGAILEWRTRNIADWTLDEGIDIFLDW